MASSLLQLLLLQWAAAFVLSASGSVPANDFPPSSFPALPDLPFIVDPPSSFPASPASSVNDDLVVATDEMRRANYFTFVMLLNMVANDKDHTVANVTFLMPNDRVLSNITFTTDSVREFMLRHSMPSPLLFDHLWHFPSGSTIPSSYPGYVLQVQNDDGHPDGKWWRRRGNLNFSLNNVKIISPNICTSPSSSIRCHGIDSVLSSASIPPPIPPVYNCAPKPAASPSDHDHTKLAPNSAPSSNHLDYGAESPPPSASSTSHIPAATHPPANVGVGLQPGPSYQLLLPLIMLLWRRG
ncbi:hypothetical protein LINGRAHAP2_LOCUS16765 [Linum grandiflorum]